MLHTFFAAVGQPLDLLLKAIDRCILRKQLYIDSTHTTLKSFPQPNPVEKIFALDRIQK
jgi:hypothetical protein